MSHFKSKKVKNGKYTFIKKVFYLPDSGKPETSYKIYTKTPFLSPLSPKIIGNAKTLKEAESKMKKADEKIEKFKKMKL